MKKIIQFTLLFLLFSLFVNAQTVPLGMKYQAVARDHSGAILANQKISLKITIYSQEDRRAQYSEIHSSVTSKLGLFSLTIGEGEIETGVFEEVPWSTSNIWMELAIDELGGDNFVTISDSKLLAVPYAFHAATANKLSGENDNASARGPGGDVWEVGGNLFSPFEEPGPESHTLGTLNTHDLIMITNNTTAMVISGSDGKVEMMGDAEVGNDLDVVNNLGVGSDVQIGSDLNVGNDVLIENNLTVANQTILDELIVKSTSNLNGALNVNNLSPTTLSGTLSVDGTTDLNNSLDVNNNSPSYLSGTLRVDGLTKINNNTQSTSPANGALQITGGVGIERNLNVAGDAKIDKTLTVTTDAGNQGYVAHFENTSNGHGIKVKVGASGPTNDNNFITFLNSSGTTVGRIEGENGPADYANNGGYQDELYFFDVDRGLAITALTLATAETVMASADVGVALAETAIATADLAAASTSSTACVGVGACATTPIPSLIAAAGANLVIVIANGVVTAGNLVLATANLGLATADVVLVETARNRFIDHYNDTKGVTYASGAGDYAEYLLKSNLTDDFMPGEVVGLKNGLISWNTLGADRVMVISFKPAVLGALPEDGKEGDYEKVAFLGQIPTKVIGKVERGDYILPSGFHNGCAIGKSPDEMLLSDYKKILGVAWEGSEEEGINYVNVAVGLNVNDLSGVIQRQQEELNGLKKQMTETNDVLARLVPGFSEATNMNANFDRHVVEQPLNNQGEQRPHLVTEDHNHDHDFQTQHDVEMVQPDEEDIVYYVPKTSECKDWIEAARKIYLDSGGKIEDHPFWNRLSTDPDYLEEVVVELKTKFEHTIHYHVDANKNE